MLWIELVVRQAAVLVATLFLPLGFAGLVWQSTSHWLRKLAEGLLAFILAKFVITAIVAVGANAIAAGGDHPAALILGAGILAVAVFTPYVLLASSRWARWPWPRGCRAGRSRRPPRPCRPCTGVRRCSAEAAPPRPAPAAAGAGSAPAAPVPMERLLAVAVQGGRRPGPRERRERRERRRCPWRWRRRGGQRRSPGRRSRR